MMIDIFIYNSKLCMYAVKNMIYDQINSAM